MGWMRALGSLGVASMLVSGFACDASRVGGSGSGGAGDDGGTGGQTGDGTATSDGSGGDTGGDGGGDESGYIFDQTALRTYELEIAEADLTWLDDNAGLEQYVPATLHFEGQSYGAIGVRYKGSATLDACVDDQGKKTCDKVSTKLKFNEYDQGLRFFGLKRLNFHAMSEDQSLLRERISYRMFGDFGVPTSRAVHAQLVVNGEPAGLFALVEQIDGRFTRSRFPADGEGNLYKEVWPIHFDEAPYLEALRTNEDESPTAAKMVRFATALEQAGDAGFVDVIESWMGVDALARYLAVDRAIDNWDGIMGVWCYMDWCGNHNYYWYEETAADRVHLVPWDHDHTLAYPNFFQNDFGLPAWNEEPATCEPTIVWMEFGRQGARCDTIIDRMVRLLWTDYVDASHELLDTLFTEAAISADIDRWVEQLAPAVAWDPYGPSPDQWQAEVESLRAAIPQLRAAILADIGG